jgi:RNA polymerase sigma-70 factor (ECF subfamily)
VRAHAPHEAEEVAQETFLRLWREPRLRGAAAGEVSAWLYRTSTRLAIDLLRRRRVWADAPEARVATRTAAAEARLELDRLARSVDPEDLEVVLLVRVDGLTHAEVAELTDRSERTVRRVLSRFDTVEGAR